MTRPRPHKRAGRPPAGARSGEKVKDYPQLSVRLPPETVQILNALSLVFATPQWRVVNEAIHNVVAQLPQDKRDLVHAFARRKPLPK